MMIFSNEDRQRAEVAADAAQVLARMVGAAIVPCDATVVPPALAGYRYSERAGLIFAHSHRQLSFKKLLDAVREVRTDLLMVEPRRGIGRRTTFHISLILCRDGEVQIHHGLRLWSADVDSPLWLVPDPREADVRPHCFSLRPNGMKLEAATPFSDCALAQMGLKIADLRWTIEIGGHFA